jgi:hypothetical protein
VGSDPESNESEPSTEATAGSTFQEKVVAIAKKRWVQVVGGIVVFFLIVSLFTYGKINSLHREGIDRETQLTATYLDAQNTLGAFISTFYEQVGIADRKSAQLDAVLSDAVKGRYDTTGLIPAVPGQVQGNQLISAIVEAYPDLSGLNTYDRILDTIAAGRQSFKNVQSVLLDKLRAYDRWRKQNIFGSLLIKVAGFPSDSLRAQIGTQFITGVAAENQMYVIVLPSDVSKAYTTGTLEPLTVPPFPGSR